MKTFGEKIKEIRLSKNMSQEEFAELLQTSKQVISRYETNQRIPKISVAQKYAKILGVSLSYLTDERSDNPQDNIFTKYPNIFKPQMKKVPLLGKTACGEPIYSPNFDNGFALINSDILADFALEAQGDSMIDAQIKDGDVVFFIAQEIVDNGQIAAVFIDNEVTLKRVYYYPNKNKLVLKPENSKYEPMVYDGEELNNIRIIGRAVAHLRKL